MSEQKENTQKSQPSKQPQGNTGKEANKPPISNLAKKIANKKLPKNSFNFYWVYALIAVALISINLFSWSSGAKEINFKEFETEILKPGDVEKLVVVPNESIVEIYIKPDRLSDPRYEKVRETPFGKTENKGPHFFIRIHSGDVFEKQLVEAQKDIPENEQMKTETDQRRNWSSELGWLLPIILMVIVWIFIMRRMSGGGMPGGQIFNIGKSRATLFDKESEVKITFNDVAGLEGAKEELNEIVDFLKNPQRYTDLGAKIPKGALLVGPPGTGKTLLAKAVAGEAHVPFFSLSGSDFVEMFVGVGASRVRDLFRQAKEKAPAIVFIDEIDAVGRSRGRAIAQGANDERENTLNQLLTEMDGFGTNTGVIILAATNRADILDRALLRAGRFDRQIYVDMPDIVERREIFKVHIRPLKLDSSADVDFLARQTPGFSGADIANVCNEAALIAARKKKTTVGKQDFLDAIDRIVGGLEKKNKIITQEEKKVIAYHEAGHAAVSWLLEHASPLVKVTIVPRGRSLGAAWYLPEERQITTADQMKDEICAALGGRAAEEIIFGKISTGALSDLEKITKQAYAMVTVFGLNDKIGNISYYDSSGQSEYSFHKPYSEKTAEVIDAEVSKIIEASYLRTKELLMNNKEKFVTLAQMLLENEVIFKEDVERIFGKRPYDKPEPEKEVKKEAKENGSEKSEPVAKLQKEATGNGVQASGKAHGPEMSSESSQQKLF